MNDPIRTSRLEIVDPKNPEKAVAVLEGASGGAGLWITGPDGVMISVYAVRGQAAIGFYDKHAQRDGKGLSFALTMGGDNPEPMIQFRDHDGEPKLVSLNNIKKAAAARENFL